MQYQSAYMSNQKAFNEKIEELMGEVKAKDEELRLKVQENNQLEDEVARLKEECNTYKGRVSNLQRDIQVS
jgi:predicted nuclease with TOPRIM domain